MGSVRLFKCLAETACHSILRQPRPYTTVYIRSIRSECTSYGLTWYHKLPGPFQLPLSSPSSVYRCPSPFTPLLHLTPPPLLLPPHRWTAWSQCRLTILRRVFPCPFQTFPSTTRPLTSRPTVPVSRGWPRHAG